MLTTIMEPLKNYLLPLLGASQIQTHKPSRRCVAVVLICPCASRRGAWRTTRTRRDPRRGSRPRHAHRTQGARAGRDTGRAGAYEAGFVFRVVVVVASSSVVGDRRGPWGVLELPKNTATTRKRSAPPRNATNSDLNSSASGRLGFLERVLTRERGRTTIGRRERSERENDWRERLEKAIRMIGENDWRKRLRERPSTGPSYYS